MGPKITTDQAIVKLDLLVVLHVCLSRSKLTPVGHAQVYPYFDDNKHKWLQPPLYKPQGFRAEIK